MGGVRISLRAALALCLPVLVVATAVIAWAVDDQIHDGQVVRNVTLGELAVGGLGEDDLRTEVEALAETYLDTDVQVEVDDGRMFETTVAGLGATVDVDATIEEALEVRRDDGLLSRPVGWVTSFFNSDSTPLRVEIDRAEARATLLELEGDDRVRPVEPKIQHTEFGFVVAPGEDGTGVAVEPVVDQIIELALDATTPIRVTTTVEDIPPRFEDSVAEELAVEANELTRNGVQISAGGETVDVPAETLAPWVSSRVGQQRMRLRIDPEAIENDLPALLDGVGQAPQPASFTVQGGTPVIVPGTPGTGCCARNSAQQIISALRDGSGVAELRLVTRRHERDAEWAEGLQIVEEISPPDLPGCSVSVAEPCRRTTHHSCCEGRVTNIQRMADLVRGAVIEPNGGIFSINDHVGERTTAKGFVEAGAIENGEHVTSVGGGISQFATTLFNAAFHAGLDIPSYQFHTEELSRYPFGRESTVSFPAPAFRIENNTPYGVLIWPEYTSTSITVHLYSTKYATGEQTGQSTSSRGNCIDITTTRTRTYVDGRTDNDTFSGYYRQGGNTTC